MYICIYKHLYVYICTYVYICIYVHVRSPITPCSLAAGGAVFIRVRTPNLTGTRRHPMDKLISNFLIALTGDIIFLSHCLLLWYTLHKWYSHAAQPCAPTVGHHLTTKTQILSVLH